MANDFIDESYLQYLLDSGALNDQLSGLGTDELKDEGTYLTQASKAGNITTDRDWLLANNAVSPGAFEPLTTLNQVDAPGWRKTMEWAGEGASPFQQYVSSMILSGKDSNAIMADLQDILANPSNDFDLQIAASLPRAYKTDMDGVQTMTDAPDIIAARNQIQSLEDIRSRDPEYTLGEDGSPVMSETKNSPMMDALIEAGYTTMPGQAFDPYELAPAGTFDRDTTLGTAEQEALERFTKAKTAQTAARKALNEAQGVESINNDPQYERQAMQRALTQADLMPQQGGQTQSQPQSGLTPQRGGVADDLERLTQDPGGTIKGWFGGGGNPLADIPGKLDRNIGNPIESFFNGKTVGMGQIAGGEEGAGIPYPTLVGDGTPPQQATSNRRPGGYGQQQETDPDAARRRILESVVRGNLQGMENQRTGARERASRQAQRATVEANTSKQAWQRASDADFVAQHANAQRAMLSQQLASQGITPFDIERKQRLALGLGR